MQCYSSDYATILSTIIQLVEGRSTFERMAAEEDKEKVFEGD